MELYQYSSMAPTLTLSSQVKPSIRRQEGDGTPNMRVDRRPAYWHAARSAASSEGTALYIVSYCSAWTEPLCRHLSVICAASLRMSHALSCWSSAACASPRLLAALSAPSSCSTPRHDAVDLEVVSQLGTEQQSAKHCCGLAHRSSGGYPRRCRGHGLGPSCPSGSDRVAHGSKRLMSDSQMRGSSGRAAPWRCGPSSGPVAAPARRGTPAAVSPASAPRPVPRASAGSRPCHNICSRGILINIQGHEWGRKPGFHLVVRVRVRGPLLLV